MVLITLFNLNSSLKFNKVRTIPDLSYFYFSLSPFDTNLNTHVQLITIVESMITETLRVSYFTKLSINKNLF
jgi:hypothetical protein